MFITDAHLDLSYNAIIRGRDVTQPASTQPVADNEIATVGFPDLRAAPASLPRPPPPRRPLHRPRHRCPHPDPRYLPPRRRILLPAPRNDHRPHHRVPLQLPLHRPHRPPALR